MALLKAACGDRRCCAVADRVAGRGLRHRICGNRCRRSTARSSVDRPLGADRHRPRRRRHSPHLRVEQARRAVRPRLRPRAGSAVADGVSAPHRTRPAVGDLRRRRRFRRTGFCARSGSAARRASAWDRLPEPAKAADRRVRRRRQRVPRRRITARALPPEFTLLRFEPEPWTGADVVVWEKMMAWDLSANYSFELLRHDIVRAVGQERMRGADAAVSGRRAEHHLR